MPAAVVNAFLRLGYPVTLGFGIGILGLVCTVLYAVPRTSILGAILLTGYLGGDGGLTCVSDPLFETLFPTVFGVMIWAGILLRNDLLRRLILLQKWLGTNPRRGKKGKMRYIWMHKTDDEHEAGDPLQSELISKMGALAREMAKSSVLLGGEGLQPSSMGVRLKFAGGERTVSAVFRIE